MSLLLNRVAVKTLRGSKNLLAFSGGIDSSALFFLLMEESIEFDIALVNYGIREESLAEEEYAKSLAEDYNITAHTIKAPKFKSNFEKSARDFRYSFFKSLIEKYGYSNLITAHQLNDQLEWFLMRFIRGAGVVELLGFAPIVDRDGYTIVRPLLDIPKSKLLQYLKENGHRYFIDKSNSDIKYERNYFRREFSDRLIDKFAKGIGRSFKYLNRDKDTILNSYREIFNYKRLHIFKIYNLEQSIRVADIYLKRLGYLLSSAQRYEIKKSDSIVVGGVWAIGRVDNLLYIAPYIKIKMVKGFKERCRVLKIPPKVRGYIYKEGILDIIVEAISLD